jgi:aspartyl-tRNA(Asn)/glutamyl-tRNA(Gln) amidotransferase subunit B
MEIVFDPDLKDGEEAGALVKELTLILQRIGTCTCRMEGGFVCNYEFCMSFKNNVK